MTPAPGQIMPTEYMRTPPAILFTFAALTVLAFSSALAQGAADSDSAVATVADLETGVEFSDTIPNDFFNVINEVGLHSYTVRLIGRFNRIPDEVILSSLSRSNRDTDYLRPNARLVYYAIQMLCERDSLWNDFFSDIEVQFREPNIMRMTFRDEQKWKSYALNELFFSQFFQELLIQLGNIGISQSRDGKEWLDGWPDELRWKYREYRFEYMPEDADINVMDSRTVRTDTTAQEEQSATLRITPRDPVLPVSQSDSVEPPLEIPEPR